MRVSKVWRARLSETRGTDQAMPMGKVMMAALVHGHVGSDRFVGRTGTRRQRVDCIFSSTSIAVFDEVACGGVAPVTKALAAQTRGRGL